MGKSFKEDPRNKGKYSHKTSLASGKKFWTRPKGWRALKKYDTDVDYLGGKLSE